MEAAKEKYSCNGGEEGRGGREEDEEKGFVREGVGYGGRERGKDYVPV